MEQQDLSISTVTQFKEYGVNPNTTVKGMLSVQAPALIRNGDERAGVDIVCTIDVSGSMQGAKLDLVILTLHHMIDVLQEKDNFGIVSFHTYIKEELPLTKMDKEGKEKAHKIVGALVAKDCTNISGGIEQSIATLLSKESKNHVRSIMLLTDGHANEGETSVVGMSRIIEKMKGEYNQKGSSGFTLHTFGFGSDHSIETLQALAEKNGGLYSYIQNNDEVGKIFANTLGGLISCIASDVKLEIEAADDVKIVNILTGFTKETIEENKKYAIRLVDLQEEERRDILFEVELLKGRESDDPDYLILRSTLQFKDLIDASGKMRSIGHLSFANRVETPKPDQESDPNYLKEFYRMETVESMRKATELAKSGNYQAAQQIFSNMEKEIQEDFDGEVQREMLSQVQNIAVNYEPTNFLSGGMYRAEASRSAQAWQRSVGLDEDASSKYTSKKKKAVMSLFSFKK